MAVEKVAPKPKTVEQSNLLSKVPEKTRKKRDETGFLEAAYRAAPEVEWDEIPDLPIPTMCVEISGAEGTGKTHAACTFPKPAVCDTEGKAWVVMKKFGIKKGIKANNFEDVISFVKTVIKDDEIETAVFDSSKDIVDMAERYSLEQLGKESLFSQMGGQVLYTHVYQKMDWIIRTLRRAGKNCVFTARMKDEYVNNNRTGNQIRDGYKKTPYQADVVIELRSTVNWNDETNVFMFDVAKVTKNGYVRKKDKRPYIRDSCYQTIIGNIFEAEADQDKYMAEFLKSLE